MRIASLHKYGYTEENCLSHTVAWLNFTIATHAKEETELLKATTRIQFQASMLAGVMFNDPEKGSEWYEEIMEQMSDGDDDGDDAWLTNPNAVTNAKDLEQLLVRRIDDAKRQQANAARSDAGSGSADRDGQGDGEVPNASSGPDTNASGGADYISTDAPGTSGSA